MHEVGLMREIVDIATGEAKRHSGGRVHSLTLRVGQLAGVDPDALAFAFDVVSANTRIAGAELIIESVPVECWCEACGKTFAPAGPIFQCPGCGSRSSTICRGQELELARMEVIDDAGD